MQQCPNHPLASMCFLRASKRLCRPETPQENAESLAIAAQFAKHLKNLNRQQLPLAWLHRVQIECCCIQAVIFYRIGMSDEAERAIDQLDTLRATPLFVSTESTDFCTLRCLLEAIDCFEKKDHPAVRRLVLHAARWAEIMLDQPQRDLDYCELLVIDLMAVSGYLRRLGELHESLKLAEQSCRLCSALRRTHPQVMNYSIRLSEAWELLAKARWDLGERASALTALQASLRYQRGSTQMDADPVTARIRESRCLDRVYHYGLLAGQHALAVQALRERAELWAGNPKRQEEVADDLLKLVESLAADHPDRACYTDEWMRVLQSLNQLQATSDSN
jgi:tetratricopeptide (TPR) repeat protein